MSFSIKFVPITTKDEDGKELKPLVSGYVKYRPSTHAERFQYLGRTVAMYKDPNKPTDIEESNNLQHLIETALKHVEEVKLERIADKFKIESKEALNYDMDCTSILVQIGTALQRGTRLGNG